MTAQRKRERSRNRERERETETDRERERKGGKRDGIREGTDSRMGWGLGSLGTRFSQQKDMS